MKNLIPLVHSLKPAEIKLITDFYNIKKIKGIGNKKLQLFNLILERKVQSNEDASRMLYKSKSDSAFCQLKKKLNNDILDILIFSSHENSEVDIFKEELECHKLLLQAKLLLSRELVDEGISMLEKVSRIAEKYEFPAMAIASHDILRTYNGMREGFKVYASYAQSIERSFEKYKELLEAKSINYSYMLPRICPRQSYGYQDLPHCDQQLQYLPGSCGSSPKINYWYYKGLILRHIYDKEFESAEKEINTVMEMLGNHRVALDDNEFSGFYSCAAIVYVNQGKNEKAIQCAQKAVELSGSNTFEQLYAYQNLFYACFRKGDIEKAEIVLEKAFSNYHLRKDKLLFGIWSVFKAALLTCKKKFYESNKILITNYSLIRENCEWDIGNKLLELQNILEIGDYDWFEFKTENLRKKLRKTTSSADYRLKLILRLFNTLMKTNFDYHLTVKIEKENLDQLKNPNKCFWDPIGFEMINTCDWIYAKALKLQSR